MSTMSPLLSWVEYYVWHSTQLNSWPRCWVELSTTCDTVLNSTHDKKSCTQTQLIVIRWSPALCINDFVSSSVRGFEKTGLSLHVKVTVLLFSIQCVTMAKVSQKILRCVLIRKIHGLVFTTRVEVLKMSWSTVADTHKSWPSWLWSHNPPPQLPFWRPIVVVFRCSHSLWKSFGNKEFEDGLLVKTVILTSKIFDRHFFIQFISY